MNVTARTAEHAVPLQLRKAWERLRMTPLWESPIAEIAKRADEKPYVWNWGDVGPVLQETAKISDPASIERRVLSLVSSRSRGSDEEMSCGVMNACYQALLPGEHARPHRHSMNALRLVLQGSQDVATVVDGKVCSMLPGDLILTPGWTWHEHVHRGTEPAYWVDILDVQLHRDIGTEAFQPGPVRDLPFTIPDDMFDTPGMSYGAEQQWTANYSPKFRYSWNDVLRALRQAPCMEDGSKTVHYTNPFTGGSCLGLMECYAIELPQGVEIVSQRSSASSIFVVIEGTGTSSVGGTELRWGPRDVFTVPQGKWFSHRADPGGARIFCANNRELYRRLGLLREEQRA